MRRGIPRPAKGADFSGCRLVGARWAKSGGDDDAAELGSHVCRGWLGLRRVPGGAGPAIADVGGVMPGGGVPAGGDGRSGPAMRVWPVALDFYDVWFDIVSCVRYQDSVMCQSERG